MQAAPEALPDTDAWPPTVTRATVLIRACAARTTPIPMERIDKHAYWDHLNRITGPNRLIHVMCTMARCCSACSVRPVSRSLSASRYRAQSCVRMMFAQDPDTVEQQLPEHRGRPLRIIGVASPDGDRVPGAEHVRMVRAYDPGKDGAR